MIKNLEELKAVNTPFITFLLYGIPEQSAVTALAFAIANVPLKWSRIVSIGTILALCAYVVRLLSIPFGTHTVLLIFILFMFLTKFVKGDLSKALIASLMSFLTLIIFEMATYLLLRPIFGVSTEALLTNPTVKILIASPQVMFLFMLAFIIHKRSRKGEAQ